MFESSDDESMDELNVLYTTTIDTDSSLQITMTTTIISVTTASVR